MSVDTVLNDTRPKMESVIEDFKRKLSNVRTGRASVGLLDSVHVDYYGTSTPLNQMASVAVPEPQLITVQPWDISQLNEERRKQLAKQVSEIAEDHRVAIRNVRHASNDALKKMLKDKEISED